jgi:hypothetical protein
MKRLALVLVALLWVAAVPASALGATRGKVVVFTAKTLVHNTGGLNYGGSFSSSKLGRGTVSYANTDVGDAISSKWVAKLKHGTLKGTATSTSTPGATPTDPTAYDGAGKIAGGTRSYAGVKGNFSITGRSNPDGTITLTLDGTVEFPVSK